MTVQIPAVAASEEAEGSLTVGPNGEQFSTISEACAAAVSGDRILVSAGTYVENPTIPDGVRLRGKWFAQDVIIQGTVTIAGTGTVREVTVRAPDGQKGVYANLASDKLLALVNIVVQGTTSSLDLVHIEGSGVVAVTTGLYHNGGTSSGAVFRLSGGSLMAAGALVGNVGSATDYLLVDGGVAHVGLMTFQSSALYTCTDGVEVSAGAAYVGNMVAPEGLEPFTNCLHVSSDGVTVEWAGSPLRGSTYDLLVDGGLVGTGTRLDLDAPMVRGKTSYPAGYRDVADTAFNFDTHTGWATYSDTTHSSGSPQTFSDGVRAQWTNDGGSSIVTYRDGDEDYWAGNEIQPGEAGESYSIRIDFTYQPSAPNSHAVLELDIGSAPLGGSSVPIVRRTISAVKGTTVQYASVGFPIYCLNTFLSNGGTVLLTTDGADWSVYDKVISLFRIH